MDLLLLAALGTLAVGFVLHPVFRGGVAGVEGSRASAEWERLTEQKERLLEALKDLEFEYKTGKLSDADYQRVKVDDLAEVARIMTRMDELAPASKPKRPKVSEKKEETSAPTCASCGQENPRGAKFCLRCGKPFEIRVECPKCGTALPKEARFCTNCGSETRT